MFPGCGFYGIREIFLEYAGLPTWLPLPVAVQHGWQRFAHTFESASNPPEIWVWSTRIADELSAYYPQSRIRVVGSFFCYLLENKKPQRLFGRSGSVCMPPHSSHLMESKYSVNEFAESLTLYPKAFQPITVMLYYLDINESVVSSFESRGFKVVTNGALFDKMFLDNFICNVGSKSHCIFGELGSGVLFAKKLGLEIHGIETLVEVENRGNVHVDHNMLSRVRDFDADFLGKLNDELVESELGCGAMLSRRELRRAILSNYFTTRFVAMLARRAAGYILSLFHLKSRMGLVK